MSRLPKRGRKSNGARGRGDSVAVGNQSAIRQKVSGSFFDNQNSFLTWHLFSAPFLCLRECHCGSDLWSRCRLRQSASQSRIRHEGQCPAESGRVGIQRHRSSKTCNSSCSRNDGRGHFAATGTSAGWISTSTPMAISTSMQPFFSIRLRTPIPSRSHCFTIFWRHWAFRGDHLNYGCLWRRHRSL